MPAKEQHVKPTKPNDRVRQPAKPNLQGSVPLTENEPLSADSLRLAAQDPGRLKGKNIQALQRSVGNRAVSSLLNRPASAHPAQFKEAVEEAAGADGQGGRTVRLPLRGMNHPVASSLAQPGTRFRLPTFDRLKAAYTDKDLKIPEKVIQDRVAELLSRMKAEKRLKSKDDVPTIISKIFPGPGLIDETEFNNALDVADRTVIYQSVLDANTAVSTVDRPGLQTAIKDAIDLVSKVEGDAAGLTAVFGAQDALAKTNYGKARKALEEVSKSMATKISTDYNLDDPEVGLGGWANFSSRHMHLLADVVKGTDIGETKATLIHEASHLADPSVDDLGYYGTAGFEAMTEKEKVGNAGHYEELPRRLMSNSSYVGLTFTPGVKKGGKAMTREDTIRRNASEFIRKAWDAAVDTHSFIRDVRKAKLSGNGKAFTDNQIIIMEISKLMELTIHTQAAGKEVVTTLDVTLTESIAHAMSLLMSIIDKVPFPSPGVLTDAELQDQMVAAAVAQYGNLLKDAKRDKALVDWLVAHYRSLPSV